MVPPVSESARINTSFWSAGEHVEFYATGALTLPEVLLVAQYREQLSGRVLDLGCGAGRVLGYLLALAEEVHGIDLSPRMVAYCNAAYPAAHVRVGDVSRLAEAVEGRFDMILAVNNLIDIFGDAERRATLAGWRAFLAPDGLLIFSTHNRAHLDGGGAGGGAAGPGRSPRAVARKLLDKSPTDLVAAVTRRARVRRNRRRLGPLQQFESDYAIVNDFPHEYSLLHYYIRRDDQARQLAELGYELVECLDTEGKPVGPGEPGRGDSLYYVVRAA